MSISNRFGCAKHGSKETRLHGRLCRSHGWWKARLPGVSSHEKKYAKGQLGILMSFPIASLWNRLSIFATCVMISCYKPTLIARLHKNCSYGYICTAKP